MFNFIRVAFVARRKVPSPGGVGMSDAYLSADPDEQIFIPS